MLSTIWCPNLQYLTIAKLHLLALQASEAPKEVVEFLSIIGLKIKPPTRQHSLTYVTKMYPYLHMIHYKLI